MQSFQYRSPNEGSLVLSGEEDRNLRRYAEKIGRKAEKLSKFGMTFGPYGGSMGGGDVTFFPHYWQSPLLSWLQFYIPPDRRILNQWLRFYDTFHPLVRTALDTHTQLPISRFELRVKDPYIRRFYEEMLDQMGAYQLMYAMLREWWLLGEVFVYLSWDDEIGCWVDGELLAPEQVEVIGHPLLKKDVLAEEPYIYYLIPDDKLVQFANSSDPDIQEMKMRFPEEILEQLSQRNKIKINNMNLMVMMRKQSPYHVRGSSILLSVLPELLYEDRLKEAMQAIAQRHILPKEFWKVGNEHFIPTPDDIDDVRNIVLSAANDPMLNLVVHFAVNYEIHGATGKFPRLQDEFSWVETRILTGLFLSKALVHGEGPTYATASISYRGLMMRYLAVRKRLEEVWRRHVFLPVAIKNGFFAITPAELSHNVRRPFSEREPIIPEFDWREKANLLDDAQFRQLFFQYADKIPIPKRKQLEILGLDPDEVKEWLKKEEGTVFDPVYQEWRKRAIEKGLGNVPPPITVAPEEARASILEEAKTTGSPVGHQPSGWLRFLEAKRRQAK
jgi:hypothetical protein